MKSLKETLYEAKEKGVGIGHFNATTVEMVQGIFQSAQSLNVPVVIGFSEGERDFFGVRQAVDYIKSLRETYDFPIYSNADHTYSLERVKEAVDVGFDAVIFDGAKLPKEENAKITKECVDYARASGREVLVEAELGYIGSSSKIWDEVPEGASLGEALTTPEEAVEFVKGTGIDLFAPAVGNIHGMSSKGLNPELNIARIGEISQATGIPLVLHGGSGSSDADFQNAIKAGMPLIHVSTEIRLAYRKALDKSLADAPDELAPYRYMKPTVDAVIEVVSGRLKLFSGQ